MKSFIDYSVTKVVTVIMAVAAVVVFGVVSFNRMTTDLIPDVNIPYAVVVTTYPGATPEEVERDVSIPLESAFLTTSNVHQVTTDSRENYSMVMIEFRPETDMDSALVEMREDLNLVLDQLPDDAGNPAIIRLNPDMLPIMNFSVSYEGKGREELTEWVEETLRPRLERIPGVATINVSGGFESEIRVTIDQDKIDDYNQDIEKEIERFISMLRDQEFHDQADELENMEIKLDKKFIGQILQAQNFSFPSGFLEVDGIEYMVRVGDALGSLEEIRKLKIFELDFPGFEAPTVTVEDVADVSFVDARERQYSKVNGEDVITLSVQKSGEYATTDVTKDIHAAFAELAEEDDFEATILLDQGEYIEMATGSVIQNLIIGGILAIVILLFFLRSVRMTFIVGVAIPVSLLFAVILIYLAGITLNIVSLGGLALGIGMLVDNSIVVIENIFRMKNEGASNKDAAVYGAHQVAGAIIASTLTTIGVFLPIMFIEDFIREIFYQLALTITFSLAASLLIALTFVPAIANRLLRIDVEKKTRATVLDKVKNTYEKVLNFFFKFRPAVLAAVVVLFFAAFFLSISRGFEFFPATDEGAIRATVEIDPEHPVDFETFATKMDELYLDLREFDDIETVGISLGGQLAMMGFGFGSFDRANVNIVLRDDRTYSTQEVADMIGELLESDYDMFITSVAGTEMDMAALLGEGIQVRIKGPELDTLRSEALDFADALADIEGLRNIDPGLGRPLQEIKVTVDKDESIKYGLTVGQVLMATAEYLEGPERITQVRMNGRAYSLYVYEEGQERRTSIPDLDTLKELVIATSPLGEPVMLADVAEVGIQQGFAAITRVDGARAVTVSADIETGYNASLVARDVEELLDGYEFPTGYDYEVLGEDEEIMAAIDTLILVGSLGILLVYMIMASQFQSFVYPLIIMFTIPLAFTGGFGILYLFGMPVSIVAIIGLIILSGVVVNNGIVLVDYINKLREQGLPLKEAIVEGGKTRLRPIFMTALTTILALTALAVGIGDGAELMQPMAITAIGGLVYATFLTIFIVPVIYYSLTLHGRYIIGGFLTVLGLGLGIYWLVVGTYAYGAVSLSVALIAALLMVFYPLILQSEGSENK